MFPRPYNSKPKSYSQQEVSWSNWKSLVVRLMDGSTPNSTFRSLSWSWGRAAPVSYYSISKFYSVSLGLSVTPHWTLLSIHGFSMPNNPHHPLSCLGHTNSSTTPESLDVPIFSIWWTIFFAFLLPDQVLWTFTTWPGYLHFCLFFLKLPLSLRWRGIKSWLENDTQKLPYYCHREVMVHSS